MAVGDGLGDPLFVYDFLAARDLIGATRLNTIHRVLDWCRAKLMHTEAGMTPQTIRIIGNMQESRP